MVDAKVATPLNESEYYLINKAGSWVKTEEDAAGHQIKHRLSRPQYVLFGDESGTYTNQMEDGNNGGHNSVVSIREFFIDRDEPAHLVNQVIHDMEGIGYTSAEGGNRIGLLFVADLLVNGSAALWVSVYMPFPRG